MKGKTGGPVHLAGRRGGSQEGGGGESHRGAEGEPGPITQG